MPQIQVVEQPGGELLVLPLFEGEALEPAGLPEEAARRAREALADHWRGRREEFRLLAAADAPAILASGLGPREDFDAVELGGWAERVARRAEKMGVERLTIRPPSHPAAAGEEWSARLARRLALAGYRFTRFQSDGREPSLGAVEILVPAAARADAEQGVALSRTLVEAVALTRDLANTPPNEATPEWMSERARELAAQWGAEISVSGPEELARDGMGGILAVGGGSRNPPRLVRIGWGDGDRQIALVGKGVTFDTGGISIKPASSMDEMKYDKSGACTVLGVLQAAVRLQLPLRLTAWLPFAENMPDGASYRPGDIVRCHNGRTVEIMNTDAEGRLLLADALSAAGEEGPNELLELSTLTGAAVVALGHAGAACYTPSDQLAAELRAAAEGAGERLWPMPLWPEFGRQMKGRHADLKNSAGRWGAANTAAAFLARFVGDLERWAHLDIAGTAYVGSDGDGPQGATGWGVATATGWLRAVAAGPTD